MARKKTSQRFCRTENFGTGVCQWPRGQIVTWRVVKAIARFPRDDYTEICRMALAQWEAVCGIRFEHTSGPANINITTRRIDGFGGVLAEAQLPCGQAGPSTRLNVWVDTGDDWVHAKNPPAGAMDVFRVLSHEFGHSIGEGHAPEGSNNLMAPTVSGLRTPQVDWDIPQSVFRYGDVSVTPPPGGGIETDPCDALTGLCGNLGTRENIGSLSTIFDVLKFACENREQVEKFLECFAKATDSQRIKRLTAMQRTRK